MLFGFVYGQQESKEMAADHLKAIRAHEDTLRVLSDSLTYSNNPVTRKQACYIFIKQLVEALKIPGSYFYGFDSLKSISIIYPEKKHFRIFTWQLLRNNKTHRYYGAIQMKATDTLKLYPLFDYSDFLSIPLDTVVDKDGWYGAVYYKILTKNYQGKTYYNLFGWDGNDLLSTRKILDVLTFDENQEPVFGAPIFVIKKKKQTQIKTRFLIEYKKDASVSMNYSYEFDMIIFDHLVPKNPLSKGIYSTYVPDGSYEGFNFKEGRWHYVEKVFHQTFEEPPIPNPRDLKRDQ